MNPVERSARIKALGLLLVGLTPAEFNWIFNPHLVHLPAIFWAVDIFRWVVLPAFIFSWGIRARLFTIRELGLDCRVFGRSNLWMFAATLIAIPALLCWLDPYEFWLAPRLAAASPVRFSYQQMIPPVANAPALHLITAIYFSVGAGLVEEFYYRGLVRYICGRGFLRSCLFIVVSLLLFAPPHLNGGTIGVIYADLFGLGAALIYLAVGNLWPLIIAHILIDFGWFN